MAEVLADISSLEEEPAYAGEFIKSAASPFSSLTWAEWAQGDTDKKEKHQFAG
jgi:hypothetical protein